MLNTLLEILSSIILSTQFFLVEGITSPQQVLIPNQKSILFVQDEQIVQYDLDRRKYEKIGERKQNELVGIGGNGELLFCEFEHFTIYSEDEFSSIFRVKNLEGEIEKELKFFETIRPVYMNDRYIIAVTAVDFLEQHTYRIEVDSGEKKEIFVPRKQLFRPDIPKDILIRNIYEHERKVYVIEDLFGNVYIYRALDAMNIIKPILMRIFNPVPRRNPTNDAQPDLRL
ncbi:MAG TPA: hypothetical protein PLN39_02170 [Candidatus Dojkabacteria bacterium]|nr:hypothetical protein [Candidatus Dojkabacteria bacterium]